MPNVRASIEYLQDLELYQNEKPYWRLLEPHVDFDPDTQRVDNLEFEEREDITIQDIRDQKGNFRLDSHGFEVLDHKSQVSITTLEDTHAYQRETEVLLKQALGATHVVCYDLRLRRNVPFYRSELDLCDPLHEEGPARGAHNDITYDSGPVIVTRHLPDDDKERYLRPGYRIRIINTWRSLLPVIEDRPLAFCDSRSVESCDLIPCDRIVPDRVGEIYYLTYNPDHRWYWMSRQASNEPFAFVMYDTKNGNHARFCPHVSFRNPMAPKDAPPRQSVETRSIVITKDDSWLERLQEKSTSDENREEDN